MILKFNYIVTIVFRIKEVSLKKEAIKKIFSSFFCFFVFLNNCNAQSSQNKDFAQSLLHVKNNNWGLAITTLEEQLKAHPEWHRARVELARVYAKVGETNAALNAIEYVLNVKSLPTTVRENVERLKADVSLLHAQNNYSLKKEPRSTHEFSGFLNTSFGVDDNVSLDSQDFFLNDLALTEGLLILDGDRTLFRRNDGKVFSIEGVLQTQFQENSVDDDQFDSSFREYNFQIEHAYKGLEMNFSWFNTLSLRKQENTDFSPFERQQLNIKSKLEWPLSEKTNFSLALNHRFLERGGEKQLTSTRLGPSLDYFNEYGSWSLSAEYTKAEYEDFIFFEFGDFVSGSEFGIGIFDTQISTLDEFNSDTLSIAGQWSQLYLDKKLFLLGKVEYSTANTSDDFDYTAQRYTLGLVYNGPSHWTWKLYASSLDVNFREARNFSDRFADSGESLRFSISYELSSLWELVIDVEKSRRTSDIFGGLESDKLLRKFGIQFNF